MLFNAQYNERGQGGAVFDMSCFFCKKFGHFAKQCPKNPQRDQSCTDWGKMRHLPKHASPDRKHRRTLLVLVIMLHLLGIS